LVSPPGVAVNLPSIWGWTIEVKQKEIFGYNGWTKNKIWLQWSDQKKQKSVARYLFISDSFGLKKVIY
jgi:hypothetical protein